MSRNSTVALLQQALCNVLQPLHRKTVECSHQCTRGAARHAPRVRRSALWLVLHGGLAMISIGRPRDIDYYLDEVSAEDAVRYYGQESMGVVSGELGRQLGLTSPIDRAEAEFLARLVDPATGERINENNVDRHFFDLTASPPKSVSILWAAAEGEQRAQIEAVLAEANASALQVFEKEASKARRGHAGAEVVDGEGLLFMTFVHTTSRADETDPQYHFHNLVLNAITGPDGRTTALDSRQLYRNRYAADAVFQATLREGLRRELGLLFTDIDDHGSFEKPESVRTSATSSALADLRSWPTWLSEEPAAAKQPDCQR